MIHESICRKNGSLNDKNILNKFTDDLKHGKEKHKNCFEK